jgi:polyphosphate kinase
LPGVSENITVRSIVDRFLEHSRIFYFENACQPEIFVGSADWMPRNFFRRIEVVFPIEDGNLRERIRSELLEIPLQDNVKARILCPDGTYSRPTPKRGITERRSQTEFIALANQGHTQFFRDKGGRQKTTRKYPKVKLAPSPFSIEPPVR